MLASGMLSLPLQLLTFLFQLGHGEPAHVCDDSIHDFLVDAKEVSYVKKDFVHVGIILSGIRGTTGTKKAIILKLEEMLQSILKSSKGTRIHFIVFTDQESRPHVTGVFRQEMGRYLSETVLFDLQVVGFIFLLLLLLLLFLLLLTFDSTRWPSLKSRWNAWTLRRWLRGTGGRWIR